MESFSFSIIIFTLLILAVPAFCIYTRSSKRYETVVENIRGMDDWDEVQE